MGCGGGGVGCGVWGVGCGGLDVGRGSWGVGCGKTLPMNPSHSTINAEHSFINPNS